MEWLKKMFVSSRTETPGAEPTQQLNGEVRNEMQRSESTGRLDQIEQKAAAKVESVLQRSQATTEVINQQGQRLIEAAGRLKEAAEGAISSLQSAAAEVELELTKYRDDAR